MFVILSNESGVASEIAAGLSTQGHQVFVETDVDVTDMRAVRAVVAERRPQAVLHMAFLDDAAACEADVDRAFLHNAESVINLVAATMEFKAVPCIWSPAQILGRSGDENEVPQPTSNWMESRIKGEVFLQRAAPMGLIVRSGPLICGDLAVNKERLQRGLTVGTAKVQPVLATWLGQVVNAALQAEMTGVLHVPTAGPAMSEQDVWCRIADVVDIPRSHLHVDTAAGAGAAILRSHRDLKLDVPPPWTSVLETTAEPDSGDLSSAKAAAVETLSVPASVDAASKAATDPEVVSEVPAVWAWVFDAGETKTWSVPSAVLCRAVVGKLFVEVGDEDHVLKGQKALHLTAGAAVRVTAPAAAVMVIVGIASD
ncbi:MAG: sugar nucleotide-binding protein [Myxococcota bacterium]